MINAQYINLNLIPSGVLPVLYCSQYDVGRPLGMVVYNGGEAVNLSTYTCTIEATRTDGTAITAAVTTDGNIGAFSTTATMTNIAGRYPAKMVIVDGSGNRVASLAFVMMVTPATMDENAESIEEDRTLYQQYTGTAAELIAAVSEKVSAESVRARAAEDAEKARAEAAESTLQSAISAEASARQAADNAIQGNVDAEASARQAADAALQAQLNQIVAPSGEAPSAAEVQNARVGADGITYSTLGDAIRGQYAGLKDYIKSNAHNISEKLKGVYAFTNLEAGLYDAQTGDKRSNSSYVRSVERIPVTSSIIHLYCDVPSGHSRSDYGVRVAYWDSSLTFIGITQQITADAVLTSIPASARYIAIEIISTTSTAITLQIAPVTHAAWMDFDVEGGKTVTFNDWIAHASYNPATSRIIYQENSAFSVKSLRVEPGERYTVKTHSNANTSNIYIWEFDADGNYIANHLVYTSARATYTPFTASSNAAYVRISANFTGTYQDPGTISTEKIWSENLLPSFASYNNVIARDPDDSTKTLTIKWMDYETVGVIGTMSENWASYSTVIYSDPENLPSGIHPGDKLWISFKKTDNLEATRGKLSSDNLSLMIRFYFNDSGSDSNFNQIISESTEIKVPDEATGMHFVLYIHRGVTFTQTFEDGSRGFTYEYGVDGVISELMLSTTAVDINVLSLINKANLGCYVSFIDDDAKNDLYCSRYYNACMHNGITGAYAIQTDLLDNGSTTAATMLEYEKQGMGMLTHAALQTSIYRADTEARVKACLADLTKAKRKMREYGFVTYNHFVIPYGTKSEDLRDIARYCGFESAISTVDDRINHMTDSNRYYIKRFSYNPQADYKTNASSWYNRLLSLINEMMRTGSGWIVVTTHFCDDFSAAANQWQSFPYDTTKDANGFDIGYTEFNDLISAIKATGAKIIPYTVGINYFHDGARG